MISVAVFRTNVSRGIRAVAAAWSLDAFSTAASARLIASHLGRYTGAERSAGAGVVTRPAFD
jgi:hypothetical protein